MRKKNKILVVLTMSIVLLGLTGTADAWSWYFTKPYDWGTSSGFFGSGSYDLTNGILYAKCAIGSGYAQAAASLGPDDMGFLLFNDQDVTITIDVTLTAWLDAVPVWPPAYAQVFVSVYLINLDTAPDSVLDSESAWSYTVSTVFGRASKQFTNYRIIKTVTLNPHDLQEMYFDWRVAVELFVCSGVFLGQARVALSGSQINSPAALRVNSISVST